MAKTKGLTYSVEVIDKTGKAIHTSRTVLGALKEARDAYKAKRAERKAERDAEKAARLALKQRAYEEQLREARRARRDARRASEDDTRVAERRRERRERQDRRLTEGNINGGSSDHGSETSSIYSSALNRSSGQLTLRSTTDLALPPLPEPPVEVSEDDDHVTALFLQVQDIIDHAAAAQSSVITLIDALRRDPETLAMVGLTLAEISTVIAKLSPVALTGLKMSWPAVFAFLASPQFAIVAGVGIGTTVVLIGGYKIIKKMIYGEPAKPPEIIDMGGKVVDEGDVRSITDRIEEIEVTETARERERSKHRTERRAIQEDPLAFGDKRLKRRHTHQDREWEAESSGSGSRRSVDTARPVPRRSKTIMASKPSEPSSSRSERADVVPLAFEIPEEREDKKGKSKLRSHLSRSRSSRSDSGDEGSRKSHKKEKDMIKGLEEGGKYMVVRRR